MIETFDCKSLITPKLGKKMRVLAPWSSNFLCLSKGFFFQVFQGVSLLSWQVAFVGRPPAKAPQIAEDYSWTSTVIFRSQFLFLMLFWEEREAIYTCFDEEAASMCWNVFFFFFLSLMIQQNADRWPYWVLFRWLNCNMWSWFEWHTYAADREDCCIQSWSMTCLRVWSIPEGRWKEEAVTRTLATTQRVWMPNLMGEKSRRKGLWWWFCDSMATRP